MASSRIILGGAPEGFDARLLAREAERGVAVVHVARDDKRMEAMRAALGVMAPGLLVLDFPAWDCLPYDRISPNPEISARRMATLAALAHGVPGPFVLLTTLNAATQKVPTREVVRAASFRATVGDRVDEARLKAIKYDTAYARSGYAKAWIDAPDGKFSPWISSSLAPFSLAGIAGIVASTRADVVHGHGSKGGLYARLARLQFADAAA